MAGKTEIPANAKVRPTPALRFKAVGEEVKLQQRYRIETNKVLFYLWQFVPVVDEDAED